MTKTYVDCILIWFIGNGQTVGQTDRRTAVTNELKWRTHKPNALPYLRGEVFTHSYTKTPSIRPFEPHTQTHTHTTHIKIKQRTNAVDCDGWLMIVQFIELAIVVTHISVKNLEIWSSFLLCCCRRCSCCLCVASKNTAATITTTQLTSSPHNYTHPTSHINNIIFYSERERKMEANRDSLMLFTIFIQYFYITYE